VSGTARCRTAIRPGLGLDVPDANLNVLFVAAQNTLLAGYGAWASTLTAWQPN